jgi:diphthamide biosynthesis enzyme Dph1/Dph2-like protein
VDEKTTQHVPDADSLIHFGPSCLSPSSGRNPVLYVFTKPKVDLDRIEGLFRESFVPVEKVVVLYDVIYEETSGKGQDQQLFL